MFKNLTIKQKLFYFIWTPILYFLGFYLAISLIIYLMTKEISTFWEKDLKLLLYAGFTSIWVSIGHWANILNPKSLRNDPHIQKRGMGEYIKHYATHGLSRFNKFIIVIYSLGILLVATIIWLMITGRL